MSQYPPALAERFAATIRDIARRVRTLENRTARVDSSAYLYSRVGTVNPAYTSGQPTVTIDGDAGLTGPYPYVASYTPAASDRVYLTPVAAGYVVVGKVVGL